jgi:hypothetical protein
MAQNEGSGRWPADLMLQRARPTITLAENWRAAHRWCCGAARRVSRWAMVGRANQKHFGASTSERGVDGGISGATRVVGTPGAPGRSRLMPAQLVAPRGPRPRPTPLAWLTCERATGTTAAPVPLLQCAARTRSLFISLSVGGGSRTCIAVLPVFADPRTCWGSMLARSSRPYFFVPRIPLASRLMAWPHFEREL